MKNNILLLLLMLCFNSSCQTTKNIKLTFQSLENELIPFLIKNKDIEEFEKDDYTSGKKHLNIFGIQNNYYKGELKDGIYSFSQTRTHSRIYFVIIEKNKFTILDITTKIGLEESIRNTLDFCERSNYCEEITTDYISRLVRTYYKKNKNPLAGMDVNCERGINTTKDLP